MRSAILSCCKVGMLATALLMLGAAASQAGEPCREWRLEHQRWKTEALRRFLGGAPQPDLDAAMFEVLQREAYLTSCEVTVEGARSDLVGWRIIDRAPEDYASAVAESVLERAGFDLDLRPLLEDLPPMASEDRRAGPRLSGRPSDAR